MKARDFLRIIVCGMFVANAMFFAVVMTSVAINGSVIIFENFDTAVSEAFIGWFCVVVTIIFSAYEISNLVEKQRSGE